MIIISPQAAIHNLQLKLPGHKSLTNAFYSAEYFLGGSFIVTRAPLVRSKYQLTRHWSQLRESSPQFRHAPPPYKIPRQNWKILQKASWILMDPGLFSHDQEGMGRNMESNDV